MEFWIWESCSSWVQLFTSLDACQHHLGEFYIQRFWGLTLEDSDSLGLEKDLGMCMVNRISYVSEDQPEW